MNVMTMTTGQLQNHVMKELKKSARGRLARRTILSALIARSSVPLNRRQREMLKTQLNDAIGAMQRRVPKEIKKSPRSMNVLLLVNRKKSRPTSPARQLVLKVMHRITGIEFACAGCGKQNTVKDFEHETQCIHCEAYFV